MKKDGDYQNQRIMLLIKLDSASLFNRIKLRRHEYVGTFSLKRIRTHFIQVFENRYRQISIADLKFAGEEVLIAMDKFYNKADDIHWYLNHTEDMPSALDEKLDHFIKDLEECFSTLQLYLSGELGFQDESND